MNGSRPGSIGHAGSRGGVAAMRGPRRTGLRLLAAVPFNYLASSAVAAFVARFAPMTPANASMAGMLVSFWVFAAIAMAAFGMRAIGRLYAGLTIGTVLLGGAALASIAIGGRL